TRAHSHPLEQRPGRIRAQFAIGRMKPDHIGPDRPADVVGHCDVELALQGIGRLGRLRALGKQIDLPGLHGSNCSMWSPSQMIAVTTTYAEMIPPMMLQIHQGGSGIMRPAAPAATARSP